MRVRSWPPVFVLSSGMSRSFLGDSATGIAARPANPRQNARRQRWRPSGETLPKKSASRADAATLPKSLEPQLAVLTSEVPSRGDWLYEVKFDGYRILTRFERGKPQIFTRRGHDWTDRMPALAGELATLGIDSAGSMERSSSRTTAAAPTSTPCRTHSTGARRRGSPTTCSTPRSLSAVTCAASATAIAASCSKRSSATGPSTSASVRRSRVIRGLSWSRRCARGLEGLIAKRADAPYVSTRSSAWLKLKCKKRQEFVVCGFTDRADDRKQVGSLLLGVYDDGALIQISIYLVDGTCIWRPRTSAVRRAKASGRALASRSGAREPAVDPLRNRVLDSWPAPSSRSSNVRVQRDAVRVHGGGTLATQHVLPHCTRINLLPG